MKKLFSYMMVCGAMMTAVLGFTSCEDDLDVQQAYPFTVETMPVIIVSLLTEKGKK